MSTWRSTIMLVLLLALAVFPGAARATHEGCEHFYGDGAHNVIGTGGADHCHGNSSNDNMYGKEGPDEFGGGPDSDYIVGMNGDDHLVGEDGFDSLDGDAHADRLRGGNGNDTLTDRFYGSDTDKVCDNAGEDYIYLDDGDGMDTWYTDGGQEAGDQHELGPNDSINNGTCPIPTT